MNLKENIMSKVKNFVFGDYDQYTSGGFTLPAGEQKLTFHFAMYQITDKSGKKIGEPALSVVMHSFSLDGSGEGKAYAYGMGKNAHKFIIPDPDNPKKLVPVAGGSGSLNNNTKWGLFLKSMYDCGMPRNFVTDDI